MSTRNAHHVSTLGVDGDYTYRVEGQVDSERHQEPRIELFRRYGHNPGGAHAAEVR